MKKLVALFLFTVLILTASQAFANLDDNRASMAAKYGDYRLVTDKDGHLWTKADWEAGGSAKAVASSYVYYFVRSGMNMQMEVIYEGNKPDSRVTLQHITPDSEIKIQDFKDYFPEVYALAVALQAQTFTTRKELTPNFQPVHSPVTLGVLVNGIPNGTYSTLLAFHVQAPGKLIEASKEITKDVYIHEFTIERIEVNNNTDRSWNTLKSPFAGR